MNRSVLLFRELKALAKKERAIHAQRYFKTGKGEYAEGDVFLGLTVPQCRLLAKKYGDLSYQEIKQILTSPLHEERLIALLILSVRYKKAAETEKEYIYYFYLAHTQYINNWDLVDTSASAIVGQWLFKKSAESADEVMEVLDRLAQSASIWERRIAIIATAAFIKEGEPSYTFSVSEHLLTDTHDLIHKAVGWMLREVGKNCSEEVEEAFLQKHYKSMPRTMLRYAIERFSEEKRIQYLKGTI